jgi:glycosyltransferase involved in cell wall biosynthesis
MNRRGWKRPRVVHVVVAGEIGGAERMLVDLTSSSEGSGADHSLVLITPNERLAAWLRDARMGVHVRAMVREGPLPFLWRALGPRDAAWIASVLVRERADIAHLHTFASQVVGTRAALRAGARVLRTEHSTRVFDDPSCWPFARWSLARAHACVAVSEAVRTAATTRAPWAAEKMCVVPNGVDTDRFTPRSTRTDGSGAFTFVLVGRLERRKGVDLAIEALARVPEVRLEVVGDGAQRWALERLASRRGVRDRVSFHGYIEDSRAIVARADAALCSSRSEGLGIALLEAMSMARPVVGFAVGGVPEVVEDNATGLLARAGDVDALAARISEARRSPDRLRGLGVAAREHVVQRFSARVMRARYADIYASLTTGCQGG